MSISIGTRNLKFMQRGTQLPAASPTPQPQASNASSSDGGSRRTKPATIAQNLPQQEQQVEEEEEEWVLPSRVNRTTTRPSAFNKTQTPAGISSGTRTRVVRQDSSYLSFINGTGAEKRRSGGSSDESGSDSDDGKPRAGEQPKNGRMTFGLLPTAERLDTSIVDQREEMKHLKAQETSSTRFKVFANEEESSSGKTERESKRKEDNSLRARKGKERNDHTSGSTATTTTPQKKPTTAKREGFLKPVLGEQRHQTATLTHSTPSQGQSSASNRRKKRKSGDRDALDMQDSEVLVSGARAKRGKKTSKKAEGGKDRDREVDMDDLAARVAGGGDDDVERYLQSVIHEMEE